MLTLVLALNECAADNVNPCGVNAACTDTLWGSTCSCHPGFQLDGDQSCGKYSYDI